MSVLLVVCVSVMSGGSSEVNGGEKCRGKGEHEGTEQRVRCLYVCPPRRYAPGLPPREQWQADRAKVVRHFVGCVGLRFFQFFPFLPFFSPFPHLFSLLLLFPPQGQGPGGERTHVVVAPAAPGAQSGRAPSAERPLPAGSRPWSRDLGIFRSRDPSPRGRTLKGERVCLGSASCRSLTFRSHGRGPPGEAGPW